MKNTIPFITIILLSNHLQASEYEGIVPYSHKRDNNALVKIIAQNYYHIFSNSPFDSDAKTEKTRLAYAQKWAHYFDKTQNTEHSKVMVMRHENQTVGYIRYTKALRWRFLGQRDKGIIDQLAIIEEHRGKKLGEQLCNHALNEFRYNGITSAHVMTTTKEVGEKFYASKLGFMYTKEISTFPIKSSTTYFWRKNINPALQLITKISKR